MSENYPRGKILIDDRALSEIKEYARRAWNEYYKPPEQISLILMGLEQFMKNRGIEVPYEVKIKGDPRDPYRC